MIENKNMLVPLSHYRKWLIPFQDEKTREFIQKARLIHGDKYDYKFVKYIGSKNKVCILCKLHGEFWQAPDNHLMKKGCKVCSKEITSRKESSNTEEFVKKAKNIHQEVYDYSEVNYINNHTKIKIFCKECNEFFWQTPNTHLSGGGCPNCGKKKSANANRKTVEKFIEEANLVHQNKYNYNEVNYINIDTKVKIICPEHGEFWQAPYVHLQGSGCPICGKIKVSIANKLRNSGEEFIKKSKEIFGDKYEYGNVQYTNCHTPVKITCKKHGDFETVPNFHLGYQLGCPTCRKEERRESQKKIFIEKAIETHGNKFDYSEVNYIDIDTEVKIICPKHGEFWQTPYNHLNSHGCPKCGMIIGGESHRLSTKDFIDRSIKAHGDKYDYSGVKYINISTPVKIICPIHGEFWQVPSNHLSGCGCPDCGFSTNICENYVEDWLSSHELEYIHRYTIPDLKKKINNIIIDYKIIIYKSDGTISIIFLEYNGLQHYEFSYFHRGNIEKFKDQLTRDEKVKWYCRKNNISLIEIPYIYNTRESIFGFLEKVITKGIDPYTFIDYESLFKRPLDYIPYSENENNK